MIQYLSGITQTTTKYMGEPTGFSSRDTSTISFDEVTRTFTISPVDFNFEVFFAGSIVRVSSPVSIMIPNTTGTHYIYFDSGTSQLASYAATDTDLDAVTIGTIYRRHAITSIVYWDATSGRAVLVADERHGITMDGDTHTHLHFSLGAQWISGLALGSLIVDGNGSLDSHAQFDVSGGVIRDEDIRFAITDGLPQDLSPAISIPTAYRIGSTWKITTPKAFPFVLNGDDPSYTGGLPAYNYQVTAGNWGLSAVTNNNYLLTHIVATNDIRHPMVALVGGTYATVANARASALTELATMSGLPFQEFVPIGTLIAQCSASYTNTPKAVFRSTSDGKAYVDWRSSKSFAAATAASVAPAMLNNQMATTTSYTVTSTATAVPGLSTTAPMAGTYIVTYSVAAQGTGSTATSTKLHLNVTINGTASPTHARSTNVITDQAVHVGTIVTLAAGDTIALTARSTVTDGTVTILANSILSYIRLS